MEQVLVDFLKGFNLQTLIGMAFMLWYFLLDFKQEIRKDVKEIRTDLKEAHHDMKFMNIRLSRLEGNTYGANIYAGLLPKDAKIEAEK